MRSIASRWRAGIKRAPFFGFAAALCACAALATKLPRYGGVLRIELREAALSPDPREWKPGTPEFASNEKLAALIFDRLVSLDEYGRFLPQLAVEWSHDPAFQRWVFKLRGGVTFSDGSALSGAEAEAALRPLLPAGMRASSSGMTLTLQSAAAAPDMLEQLASGRYFIFHDAGDGRLAGTGAFILTEASHSRTDGKPSFYTLQANNSCWAGRPFLDRVEITAGLPALKRLLDLELGQADVIELAPELVRRARQEDLRVWTSDPVTLFGLRLPDGDGAEQARLREAISLSLDRVTMAGVLLQRQAQPAAALLPEWLSGYASLFSIEPDSESERELRGTPKLSSAAAGEPMLLRVDAPGELAKLLGDRVALNARQKGVNLQLAGKNQQTHLAPAAPAEVRLFVWRFTLLSAPAELAELQASLRVGDSAAPGGAKGELQQLYAKERKLLEDRRVAPLVLLPEYIGLSANIRDWMPARWGEWRLADAWLDTPAVSSAPPSETPSRTQRE